MGDSADGFLRHLMPRQIKTVVARPISLARDETLVSRIVICAYDVRCPNVLPRARVQAGYQRLTLEFPS